ncbi:MAG: hypothetical protein IKO27_01465 [Ruminococcus sp.]|nr:hypothetical protein [Ruminococcus sp.]
MFRKLIVAASAAMMIFGAAAFLPADTADSPAVITASAAASISGFKVTIPYSSYTYRGRGIKPTVTVKDSSGNALVKDTDFTVSYSNNTNVGTANITVKGIGKYSGTVKKTFTVKPLDLTTSYASVSIPYGSYTYTGSSIRPKVSVNFKTGSVIPASEYSVSYSNNLKVGCASYTVKGLTDNVTGTLKKGFVVKPAKNRIVSLLSSNGTFRLRWEQATEGSVGYQVLYSQNKDALSSALVETPSTNAKKYVHSYSSTDLDDLSERFSRVPAAGETWYVKVRSFMTKDGKSSSTRYGNYSSIGTVKVIEGVPQLVTAKEFIAKACTALGTKYASGGKGAGGMVIGGEFVSIYDGAPPTFFTASQLKTLGAKGIDCSGLVYWSLGSLGVTSENFNQYPMTLAAETWHYYNGNKAIKNASFFRGGVEAYATVVRDKLTSKKTHYWTADSGGTIPVGSIVVVKNKLDQREDHTWIYLGEASSRTEIINKLVNEYGVRRTLLEKSGNVVDKGNGSTHWRIEAAGGSVQQVQINNGEEGLTSDNTYTGTLAVCIGAVKYA